MGKVLEEFREFFDPDLRAAKERALVIEQTNAREEALAKFRAQASALRDSEVIAQFRDSVLGFGATLQPNQDMDASGAYWMRRGIEQAVHMLDELIADDEAGS